MKNSQLSYLPSESGAAEVEMFLSTVDQEVNAGSTVNLSCVAYGSLSAPSIEWTSVTGNGRTSTIRNSIKVRLATVNDLYMELTQYYKLCSMTSATEVTTP